MNILVISVVVSIVLIFLVIKNVTSSTSSTIYGNGDYGDGGEEDAGDVSCVTELNNLKKILKEKNLERKKTCSEQVILIKEKIQRSQAQIDTLKNHRRNAPPSSD